ncbi:hypothetical protein [Sphingomonas sp.]|uniref:hypothetical protein n=1 Tax=Sphingomonas sp. TaxID=28214 RepID=UPI001817C855|nr:hypothetical protein [Sphingomonas sp.]MBA4762251.1 hypothetical protein [Sphingomonas sp.]
MFDRIVAFVRAIGIPVTEDVVAADSFLPAVAVAWSYAAAVQLGIDPGVVFDEGGSHGRGPSLAQYYAMGLYIGRPELAAAGMARDPRTAPEGAPVYPAMVRWLR